MKIENEYRDGEGAEGEKERRVLRWTCLSFIVDKMGGFCDSKDIEMVEIGED